jgi:hypothetical protein
MNNQSISGRVIRVGTMIVDEQTISGIFIEVGEDVLKNSEVPILFQNVTITEGNNKNGDDKNTMVR